jgi:hypothetical protein
MIELDPHTRGALAVAVVGLVWGLVDLLIRQVGQAFQPDPSSHETGQAGKPDLPFGMEVTDR